jgi:hypothetical protein
MAMPCLETGYLIYGRFGSTAAVWGRLGERQPFAVLQHPATGKGWPLSVWKRKLVGNQC